MVSSIWPENNKYEQMKCYVKIEISHPGKVNKNPMLKKH
jgi:hypothetical protein